MAELQAQDTIIWNSAANATNHTSTGAVMDGGFQFEVGVFNGSFVPNASNKSDWAANWTGHRRSPYDATNKLFGGMFVPSNNNAPFIVGANAYVWGFRGSAVSGEWILFRAVSWTWPNASSTGPPLFHYWEAEDATPVLGQIHASGSPFLMKSAAVTNATPPSTSYSQWQTQYLTGEPLNAPNQDPDKDGVCNLLEFVFDTPPKTAGAPVSTPITLVSGCLQISLPRRADHTALLTVEVSGNLTDWFSGAAHTVVVSDLPAALIVRDLTPLGPANPRRFIRMRAVLP